MLGQGGGNQTSSRGPKALKQWKSGKGAQSRMFTTHKHKDTGNLRAREGGLGEDQMFTACSQQVSASAISI